MSYEKVEVPEEGEAIEFDGERLSVPDTPIIPIIYGDGIGVDVAVDNRDNWGVGD